MVSYGTTMSMTLCGVYRRGDKTVGELLGDEVTCRECREQMVIRVEAALWRAP